MPNESILRNPASLVAVTSDSFFVETRAECRDPVQLVEMTLRRHGMSAFQDDGLLTKAGEVRTSHLMNSVAFTVYKIAHRAVMKVQNCCLSC